jgi:phospholipid/cholesterol/gamma-HCH transport system ATP-binding protein
MIAIRNLYKRFGTQEVLRGINLDIHKGETLAIIGPSGAGKSVLIKLMMGLLPADSGSIIIDGEDMCACKSESAKNLLREKFSMLFQSAALFDSLTVLENILFPLMEGSLARSMSKKSITAKVMPLIESLSLNEVLSSFPQSLSLGVRKRVGMARALISKPEVILFDEPNTGLDPYNGQEVYDLIRHSQNVWGFTGIVISHELPEVFQVVNRVAMLLNGEIIFQGTPTEFLKTSDTDICLRQFLLGLTEGPITIH